MKVTKNMRKISDDVFVTRWFDNDSHQVLSQGKRLQKSATNLTKEIQHWYVKKGSARAVRVIKETLDLSLLDSYHILEYLRGDRTILQNPSNYKEIFGV